MKFTSSLEAAFQGKSNPENAFAMSKYMRNHFSFFGIKTEERRQIFKAIWKENKQEVDRNPREIALELYSKPERELQYCAIEILMKQLKGNYKKEDIQLIEKLISTNSWWDSVDTIAKTFLANTCLNIH
jgi:3-methyladenine DNA glycosylase AlkD